MNVDKRLEGLLSSSQTVSTLKSAEVKMSISLIALFTLGASNLILALPLTKVAAICMMTASMVYAELQP